MPLNPQVKALLETLAAAGGPPLDELSVDDARTVYKGLSAFDQPEEVTRVDDRLPP